jgi:hypothetical protein
VTAPNDALELGCGLQEGSGSSRSDPRFREKSLVIGPVVFFPARSEYRDSGSKNSPRADFHSPSFWSR